MNVNTLSKSVPWITEEEEERVWDADKYYKFGYVDDDGNSDDGDWDEDSDQWGGGDNAATREIDDD